MNAIANINTFEAIEIPVVMTREDWEKEYEAEYKKECILRLRKYFKWKLRKIYINAIKIMMAAAIFYGIMSVIAIFVESICRYI